GLSPQRWAHDGGDAVARPEAVGDPGGRRGRAGRGGGSAHGVENSAARALPNGTALRADALRDGVERPLGWPALWYALLSVLRGVHVGAAGIRNDESRRGRRDRRAHHSGAYGEKAGSRGASHRPPHPRRRGDGYIRTLFRVRLGRDPFRSYWTTRRLNCASAGVPVGSKQTSVTVRSFAPVLPQ